MAGGSPDGGYKPLRRWRVPGFCRAVRVLDWLNHKLNYKLGIICDLDDWSLGLTWKEARS